MRRWTAVPVLLLLAAGCAIRLGGTQPETYRTMALEAEAGASAADVAERIRGAEARVVLLSAHADSAWFAEVARLTELELSGPGGGDGAALGFLAGPALGDTTLTLEVEGGGGILVHDALYEVDDRRFLDLMAVRIDQGTDLRAALRALLAYVATDVMPNAAVALAVDAPSAEVADSIASLLRPAFGSVAECTGKEGAAASTAALRLFIGPEMRARCENARVLPGPGAAVVADLVVAR